MKKVPLILLLIALILFMSTLIYGCSSDRGATGEPGTAGAQGLKGVTGDIGPVGPQGPEGKSGDALAFPDGFDGATSIVRGSLFSSPYTIPSGKTLYINNINNDGWTPNNFKVDGIAVAPISGFNSFQLPIVVGDGQTLSAELRENSSDIVFNGFLVDTSITPITQNNLVNKPYAVPSGKTLYINHLNPDFISYTELLVDGTTVCSITKFYSCQHPIVVQEGQVISTDPHNITINGYLMDN